MVPGMSTTTRFERSAIRDATLDDLDATALAAYVRQRAPNLSAEGDDLAIRTGMAARLGQSVVPTAAGLLLFGRLPQLLFPQWGLCAVRIRGTTMAAPVAARADLEGPLAALVSGALRFVGENTFTATDQVHKGAIATEYPAAAVREALVNALVHRDLRHTSRVALQVFDDRLVVRSPGGLPQGLPPLDELSVFGGVSVPRNPLLATSARILGLGEQLGRGLTIIRREAREQTLSIRIVASQHEVRVEIPSELRPPD